MEISVTHAMSVTKTYIMTRMLYDVPRPGRDTLISNDLYYNG
jgi:hypothetical protein